MFLVLVRKHPPALARVFTPVLKYDARAGRFFRVDRVDTGNGFASEQVDITQGIKFIADFENIEVGWIVFTPGSAPDFKLVPIGSQLPDRPSAVHKNGLRFMLKLSKECGGDKPIRRLPAPQRRSCPGSRRSTRNIWRRWPKIPASCQFLTVEKNNAGQERIGSAVVDQLSSAICKISGWAPRGDLVFEAKGVAPSVASQVLAATAPSTGSSRVAAPTTTDAELAEDFG